MATPKKKHLIELMIEAGVKWPEGAEYAAQDNRDLYVWFYSEKPKLAGVNKGKWTSAVNYENGRKCRIVDGEKLNEICLDWHQTIVTREQYAEAVAERNGWIQWKGGERPVHRGCHVEVKLRNGDTVRRDAGNFSWWYLGCRDADIIAYRVIEKAGNPSIEQLTADYHAKAAEADRLQDVADEALKAADDALLALEKAVELIGMVISVDTNPKQVGQPIEQAQPIITDWRDLRVGDVIWWEGDAKICSGEYTVERVEEADYTGDCVIFLSAKEWVDLSEEEWRFVRRP